jgi:hypothetical protein
MSNDIPIKYKRQSTSSSNRMLKMGDMRFLIQTFFCIFSRQLIPQKINFGDFGSV